MENKSFSEFFRTLWKKKGFRIFSAAVIIVFLIAAAFPGWLFFHKPAFRGRVLDAGTGEPIEGAVVVVMYYKERIVYHLFLRVIAAMLGGMSDIIEVKETLTDKNGDFGIAPYTAMINPLTREGDTDFIIFKPGYGRLPLGFPGDGMEKFFSEHFGIKGELEDYIPYEGRKMVQITFGIVTLPKMKTGEVSSPSRPSALNSGNSPLLHKVVNEYRRSLGFTGELK